MGTLGSHEGERKRGKKNTTFKLITIEDSESYQLVINTSMKCWPFPNYKKAI